MSLARLGTIGIAILGIAASANADTFSFQGNFIHDNDVQLLHFGLLTAGLCTRIQRRLPAWLRTHLGTPKILR